MMPLINQRGRFRPRIPNLQFPNMCVSVNVFTTKLKCRSAAVVPGAGTLVKFPREASPRMATERSAQKRRPAPG